MTRLQVFLIRLGISLSIFGVLAYLVAKMWYPDFFFQTDGGWQDVRTRQLYHDRDEITLGAWRAA